MICLQAGARPSLCPGEAIWSVLSSTDQGRESLGSKHHRLDSNIIQWNFTWPKLALCLNMFKYSIWNDLWKWVPHFQLIKSSPVSLTWFHSCSWVIYHIILFPGSFFGTVAAHCLEWALLAFAASPLPTTQSQPFLTGRLLGSRCLDNSFSYHRLGKFRGCPWDVDELRMFT